MSYKDIINSLSPIPYSKYKDITSYEKLMLYVAMILHRSKIPITFNYLCIAAYKIFPDAFCCDEEFKEFPSVDRLNRTLMHLKYVKKGKPYLAGSVKDGYSLTNTGLEIAQLVDATINNTKINKSVAPPPVDKHKKGFSKDYLLFISGESYIKYLETKHVDISYIWEFYKIIPFTQIKKTKENLKNISEYAKTMRDDNCYKYIESILKILH